MTVILSVAKNLNGVALRPFATLRYAQGRLLRVTHDGEQ